MKTAGAILIIIGLIMTLYTGVYHDSADVSMNMGDMDISMHTQENTHWQPYLWIGVMVIGGAVLMLGGKKTPTT